VKAYCTVFLFFVYQINAMEPEVKSKVVESKSSLFASGNNMHQELARACIEESGITLKDKFILDIESKTGEVSNLMVALAGGAGIVLGLDSDKENVKKANKLYGKLQNLSFHAACIKTFELFKHLPKFHVVTAFNCFDLFDDKREVCKKIHQCLNTNGEVLLNMGWGKEPIDLEVTREMITSVTGMGSLLYWSGLDGALKKPYPTEQEYHSIFKDSGFEIISLTKKMSEFHFKNKEEFIAMKKSVVMDRPEMKKMPFYAQNWIFNTFIERLITKLQELGQFKEDTKDGSCYYFIEQLLIYARKT
jgi:SAM-dependent methyltransferase